MTAALLANRRLARLSGLVAATVVLFALAAQTQTARAQQSEEFVLRVAARLNTDGRIEFGIQRIDAEGTPRLLHLEHERLFPRDVSHHRWLRGGPTFLVQAPHYDARGSDRSLPSGTQSAKARVIARVHPEDGRVEFAVQHELDLELREREELDYSEPVFPSRRFFPADVTHNRWLYSSEIRFTRTWADDGMMEAEPSLESESGDDEPGDPVPEVVTLAICLAAIADGAMPSDSCTNPLYTYCQEHRHLDWCAGWTGYY